MMAESIMTFRSISDLRSSYNTLKSGASVTLEGVLVGSSGLELINLIDNAPSKDVSGQKEFPLLGFHKGIKLGNLGSDVRINVYGRIFFDSDPVLGSYAHSHPDTIPDSRDHIIISEILRYE